VVFGVGGINVFHNSGLQPINIGMPLVSDDSKLDSNNCETIVIDDSVFVTQYCTGVDKDVEAGELVICADIPDTLPICVTTCYLRNNWEMYAFSYGGYHPANGPEYETTIEIDQKKTGKGGIVNIEWSDPVPVLVKDLCIYIEDWDCIQTRWGCFCWPDIDFEYCWVYMYTATFEVDDAIQLESNHLPAVYGNCLEIDPNDPTYTLGKEATLYLQSDWAGCDDPRQVFEVLLAHKKSSSRRSPTPNENSSPV